MILRQNYCTATTTARCGSTTMHHLKKLGDPMIFKRVPRGTVERVEELVGEAGGVGTAECPLHHCKDSMLHG